MKRHSLWIWALLLLNTVLFTSCHETQTLEVSKSLIVFSFSGGYDFFNVEANCDWTIEMDETQHWLNLDTLAGSNNGTVALSVRQNTSTYDRSTTLTVVSQNGKIRREVRVSQAKIDINPVTDKVWFLRFYERWNTDYWDNYIPESYRTWTYYTDIEFENWYFYFFNDNTGYQIHTQEGDTIYYPYQYDYFSDGDSLLIVFESGAGTTMEDYHAVIHELNNSNFSFSDAYRPHYFEKLNTVNVSNSKRNQLKVNPKKVTYKTSGPLIPVK